MGYRDEPDTQVSSLCSVSDFIFFYISKYSALLFLRRIDLFNLILRYMGTRVQGSLSPSVLDDLQLFN